MRATRQIRGADLRGWIANSIRVEETSLDFNDRFDLEGEELGAAHPVGYVGNDGVGFVREGNH